MYDQSTFPDATYKLTVLAPLFECAKTHFVRPVRDINRAHLVMLGETGILSSTQCHAIANALHTIDNEIDVASLSYTGEHEDYFFLVESELKRHLGADEGGLLHTARSRNDMDHTIFKMVLKQRCDLLLSQATALANTFLEKATAERDTLIVAYTHGQPAQPTTLGHYLCAALEVLLRDLERLSTARENLDHCPMGAAAITTSGFPVNRERVAELLGFKGILLNSYGCIASVDYVTGLYSAIKLVFLHLGRLIQDFQFWTAFEVGQLYIPNSLVQISSIMPQKRNPVPIEHLRHLASMTCGRCDAIVNTMHNTPFTDMNDSEGEVQQAGYAGFESAGRVLELLSVVIENCSVQTDRVTSNTDRACITVTELADTLVRTDKLSFRQAHEIAASTAASVIATAEPMSGGYQAFLKSFKELTGNSPTLSSDDFYKAVSAEHFVNVRERPGGPAPAAMDAAFNQYQKLLSSLQSAQQKRLQHQHQSAELLDNAFNALHRQ